MDSNDYFEGLAVQFHQETGYVAPGKDIPAAMGADLSSNYELRTNAWEKWISARRELFLKASQLRTDNTALTSKLDEAVGLLKESQCKKVGCDNGIMTEKLGRLCSFCKRKDAFLASLDKPESESK